MTQATTGYAITADDKAAYLALLKLQSDIGRGTPPPGQAQLLDFFGVINDMAYDHYRLATNAQIKSWMDAVFNVLIQTKTCYTINGAGLYVLYMYYQLCMDLPNNHPGDFPPGSASRGGRVPIYQADKDTVSGRPWYSFTGRLGVWKAPASHAGFYDSIGANIDIINGAMAAVKDIANTNMVWLLGHGAPSKTIDEILQFQQSRFDPANWTDSNIFVQNFQKITAWQDQSDMVNSLIKEPTLTADAYFFLLHVLIGLGTSSTQDQQLALKIVNAPATSMEYPNDTFINQLIYLTLMYLADPLGDYDYNNSQLIGMLNDLNGLIVSTDAASAAIKTSITKSFKILHSDASYPTQDLYNPTIGFDTRQTDTLAALDSARTGFV